MADEQKPKAGKKVKAPKAQDGSAVGKIAPPAAEAAPAPPPAPKKKSMKPAKLQ